MINKKLLKINFNFFAEIKFINFCNNNLYIQNLLIKTIIFKLKKI